MVEGHRTRGGRGNPPRNIGGIVSQVWFTSDQHIGHKLVSGLRGFWDPDQFTYRDSGATVPEWPDTDAHDAHMAEVWDSQVGKRDIVYVLGDISINGGAHALEWFKDRPGLKHLIAGNHDPVHPMHSKSTAALQSEAWTSVFATIQPFARRKRGGRTYLLNHFPYASFGDGEGRGSNRYNEWRMPDMGLPLLHGHTHGNEIAHDNMYHVGWDAHRKLVPLSAIDAWIDSM